MRFLTRYHLTWPGALKSLGETFYYEGLLFLLALIFLPMPGCLLLLLFHKRWIVSLSKQAQTDGNAWPWDPAAWWGTALALGIATWPLLWLWLTVIGGRWTGWLLWLVIAAGWFAVAWLWWRDKTDRRQRIQKAGESERPAATSATDLVLAQGTFNSADYYPGWLGCTAAGCA